MYNQLVALTVLTLILGFTVTGYAQEGKKPPLSSRRIAGEFLAGVAGGTATALIPFYLFSKLYLIGGTNESKEWGLAYLGLMYLPVGYAIGSTAGVYLAGNVGNETGSFLKPLVGSSVVAIGGFWATWKLGWAAMATIPVLLVGVPTVATIIFNLTRKYK